MMRVFRARLNKTRSLLRVLLPLALFPFAASGQQIAPKKYAVQASATVSESPAQIRLSWVADSDAIGYSISRRTGSGAWTSMTTLNGSATNWTDGSVQPGQLYEYRFHKTTSRDYEGFGYIASGIGAPVRDLPGKLILMVESSLGGAIEGELRQLEQDLRAEGWTVVQRRVNVNDSPRAVKQVIQEIYEADPANTKAVFLIGHVPVPYSGNIAPDGHENHQGAWPADVYYGDVDGAWTDTTVNSKTAERQINWNVPGDGKFDQSVIPSTVELMVGRVDFSNMTCFANKIPARSELDLTRAYLRKNREFRTGQWNVAERALICDNFSDKGEDPIAGSAWRAFPGFFGSTNIHEAEWDGYLPAGTSGSYLWSYASGGGSYYYSMGVGTSDDFALQDLRVVFTMWMGSYFGDWNNESNFLRAALGSGNVLSSTYSGFPHTYYFPMAMGEMIGECVRRSQNNATNGLYAPWNQGTSQPHISLLGDPTLRMHPIKPASNLAIASDPGQARLSWSASTHWALQGYYIYRSHSAEGPFIRLTSSPHAGTSYTDAPGAGSFVYMVRPVVLKQSASGTYLNPGPGIFASASIAAPAMEPLKLAASVNGPELTLTIAGQGGQRYAIEWTSNFTTWTKVSEGELTASTKEVGIPAGESEKRFFRARNLN